MLDQVTRLILIRHGETLWNRVGRIQGHTDVPLSPLGQAQAAALGLALADEPINFVYSSDLSRAHQTAQALARPVILDPRLRERCFGRFEGMSWDEIGLQSPDAATRWRRREPDFAVGGGESLTDFSARCLAALRHIASAHPGGNVAVVAHGGVLDCFYRAACGIALDAPRAWPLGNATINRLLASDGQFSLIGWNDDRHLQGVALDDPAVALG